MTQEETYSLLAPRYLRGELSAVETAEFEAYLNENPEFQADIEFQRNLMAARPDDLDTSGLEFGWARLSRSIDSLESENTADLKAESKLPTPARFQSFWKVAALALACFSIGQAVYITNSQTEKHYQLASEEDAAAITLQVGFEADLSLNEISRFLVDHDSQIISGPGNLGIYTLSFSDIEKCQFAINALISKEQFVETYTSCHASTKD